MPALTTLDARDGVPRDAVVDGDLPVQAGVVADGVDLGAGQLGAWVVLAMLWCAATLRLAIAVVVALRPEEQMVDTDARRVVAVMEHAHPRRDLAVNRGPGTTMSHHPQPPDSQTDVTARSTLANGFDARSVHMETVPTFGGT